jgi:hypothetical protein
MTGPQGEGRRGRLEFRRSDGGVGRGRGGEALCAHLGLDMGPYTGGDNSGELARRRRTMAAAGVATPVKLRLGRGNEQTGEL